MFEPYLAASSTPYLSPRLDKLAETIYPDDMKVRQGVRHPTNIKPLNCPLPSKFFYNDRSPNFPMIFGADIQLLLLAAAWKSSRTKLCLHKSSIYLLAGRLAERNLSTLPAVL